MPVEGSKIVMISNKIKIILQFPSIQINSIHILQWLGREIQPKRA